jgi:hypothetical protein
MEVDKNTIKRILSEGRSWEQNLGITLDRDAILKILSVGQDFDFNKGGYCDARSGCVNFWCGPYDKPECWTHEIIKGALNNPRDFVGGLYWNWVENEDRAELYVEIHPYSLLDNMRKKRVEITEEEKKQCLDWCVNQAKELLRLAGIK